MSRLNRGILELPKITPSTLSNVGVANIAFDVATSLVVVSVDGGAYGPIAGVGAVPGGANTNVQFNSAGVFAGSANFLFDGTNVTILNALAANTVSLTGAAAPFFNSVDGAAAGLSAAGEGRLRYNDTTKVWEESGDGAAYTALGGGILDVIVPDVTTNAYRIRQTAGTARTFFRIDTNAEDMIFGESGATVSQTFNFFASANSQAFFIRNNTTNLNYFSIAGTGATQTTFGSGTTSMPTRWEGPTTGTGGPLLQMRASLNTKTISSGGQNGGWYFPLFSGVAELVVIDGGTNQVQITSGGGLNGAAGIVMADNAAGAFNVAEGANNSIDIDTTDGAERIALGNAVTDPDISLLGQGAMTVGETGATVGFMGAAAVSVQSITGALSTVTDADAKAVLTSIIAALVNLGLATDGTT